MTNLYTVKRDNICAGQVITDFEILQNQKNLCGQDITITSFYPCRSILYTRSYDDKAEDLLYNSPNYPIFDEDNIYACKDSKYMIYNHKNIGRLLKLLGYDEELDYLEVENLRKTLFNGRYPLENLEKFGLVEANPETQNYYDERGNLITNPDILKKLIRLRKRQQASGRYQEFEINGVYEGLSLDTIDQIVIPREYFELLRDLGDNSFRDVIRGYEERMNAFKPHKEEGPIRSLKKYDFS